MLTVCAWCLAENRPEALKVVNSPHSEDFGKPISHGICEEHQRKLLEDLHECQHS